MKKTKMKKESNLITKIFVTLFTVFIAYGLITTFPLVWFLIYYFNGWAF